MGGNEHHQLLAAKDFEGENWEWSWVNMGELGWSLPNSWWKVGELFPSIKHARNIQVLEL